jgi:hypothetical protein
MTLPNERYRSIEDTRNFLQDLLDPKKTPRVPKEVRKQAHWCLRHFPYDFDMELAAKNTPTVFKVDKS